MDHHGCHFHGSPQMTSQDETKQSSDGKEVLIIESVSILNLCPVRDDVYLPCRFMLRRSYLPDSCRPASILLWPLGVYYNRNPLHWISPMQLFATAQVTGIKPGGLSLLCAPRSFVRSPFAFEQSPFPTIVPDPISLGISSL
jgi:hypothetical protein